MATSQLKLYEQTSKHFKQKVLIDFTKVKQLTFSSTSGEGLLELTTGEFIPSICMRCSNPTCMHFTKEELSFATLDSFPADSDHMVCPSLAITWPHDHSEPVINESLCISCGLCIKRCPIGAIQFNENFIPKINTNHNEYYQETSIPESEFSSILQFLNKLPRSHIIEEVNDGHLQKVYSKIYDISSDLSLQFPNLIIRNLLLELNLSSVIRRRGDIYARMDLLFSDDTDSLGTAEIETGGDILNSPRNILDNIAVLHSRYGFPKEKIYPLIVSFTFPNQRSEYWQVISDIKKVTGIEIFSITLGALLMLLWQNRTISMEDIKLFYADSDTYSIRESVEKLLGDSFNISIGQLGILEITK